MVMKKISTIIVMFLVTAAVVFAAGCAEEQESAENETPADAEQVSSVTPETPGITDETVTNGDTTQGDQTIETGRS